MNQKQIGIIVMIVGIVLAGLVYSAKVKEDGYIQQIENQTGSCYLDDGSCLHADRNYTPLIIGWVLSAALIMLGLYLVFFDKTQKLLLKQQEKIAGALKESKEKDEFTAFVSGFNEQEQKVLKAIKEQEGIQQSTLRYRTGISKTALSLLLKSLEERDIITKKVSGKTNKLFLRKKF